MSVLANLASDPNAQESGDSVGGGGPLASGLYPAKVKLAYVIESKGGATGVVLHTETETGGQHRETVYVTSGREKGQKTTYEKDGKTFNLPGFDLINSLCLLGIGKELSQCATEKKTCNLYDYDLKKETPQDVDVIVDLLGADIIMGVINKRTNKNVRGDDGKYHPTNEERRYSEIDKFFRAKDSLTVAEIRGGAESAEFINTWRDKWEGNTFDDFKEVAGAAGQGTTGAFGQAPAAAAPQPENSLFASE